MHAGALQEEWASHRARWEVPRGLLTDSLPAVELSPELPGLRGNEKPPLSCPLPRAEREAGQEVLGAQRDARATPCGSSRALTGL